jgi:uncharacterized BrkB/YihY/UPF0761 family membrane protein
MPAVQPTEFRYTRAIITFFAAYVIVTLLAVALSMAAEAAMHNPPTLDMVHSPSYVFAEKFFPIINLLVWTAFSWVYFKLRRNAPVPTREALTLGAFWLLFAILVDYVGFVLIKNPFSLSPTTSTSASSHGFTSSISPSSSVRFSTPPGAQNAPSQPSDLRHTGRNWKSLVFA